MMQWHLFYKEDKQPKQYYYKIICNISTCTQLRFGNKNIRIPRQFNSQIERLKAKYTFLIVNGQHIKICNIKIG